MLLLDYNVLLKCIKERGNSHLKILKTFLLFSIKLNFLYFYNRY